MQRISTRLLEGDNFGTTALERLVENKHLYLIIYFLLSLFRQKRNSIKKTKFKN